jgi:hypothetical protein
VVRPQPASDHFGDSFLLGLVPHQRVFVVSSEPERDYLRRFPLDVARPYGAQSSQRSTCPPSAAVRQVSIADITFNWGRLT